MIKKKLITHRSNILMQTKKLKIDKRFASNVQKER